jgi:UDP-N-acetylmuramoylalanine-D-glutamate ligase
MFRQAAALCGRDEERRLVIEVSRLNPSAESLALVTPYLSQSALAKEAATAAVAIAEKIAPRQPQAVAAAMQQVLAAKVAGAPAARAKQLLDSARDAKPRP